MLQEEIRQGIFYSDQVAEMRTLVMYFIWNDIYSVNLEEVDKQHKKMFQIGRRISELVLLKDNNDYQGEIKDIINELENYTLYHFGYEEKLMTACNYNEFEYHRMEHVLFIKKLKRLKSRTEQSEPQKAIIALIEFVSDWICEHILKTDKRFSMYYQRTQT